MLQVQNFYRNDSERTLPGVNLEGNES